MFEENTPEINTFENTNRFDGTIKLLQGESNPQRLKEWLMGENVPPTTVEVGMSNRCNHLCERCIGEREDGSDLIDPSGVVDQVAAIGSKAIIICGGGEPFLNPHTPQTIQYAKSRGLDVGVVSNGSVTLSDADILALLQSTTFFRISLDASNPDDYQYTHGMPTQAFEKVVRQIQRIGTIKAAHPEISSTFGVGYLTDQHMLDGMAPLAQMFGDTPGIDFIQFRPFRGDHTPIDAKIKECLSVVAGKKLNVLWTSRYQELGHSPQGKCLSPYFQTYISASGKVYLCCHHMGEEQYTIGDVNIQSFSEIWAGSARQKILEEANREACPTPCRWSQINNLLDQARREGWTPVTVDQLVANNSNLSPNPHAHFL